jgi:hypothetical protein
MYVGTSDLALVQVLPVLTRVPTQGVPNGGVPTGVEVPTYRL